MEASSTPRTAPNASQRESVSYVQCSGCGRGHTPNGGAIFPWNQEHACHRYIERTLNATAWMPHTAAAQLGTAAKILSNALRRRARERRTALERVERLEDDMTRFERRYGIGTGRRTEPRKSTAWRGPGGTRRNKARIDHHQPHPEQVTKGSRTRKYHGKESNPPDSHDRERSGHELHGI